MLADPTWTPDLDGGAEVHVAVYLPLVVPVLAALAARPLADRLPPAAATWLLAASALALALASSAVLGMLALSALVRIPVIDAARAHVRGRSSAAVTRLPAGRDRGRRPARRGGRGRGPRRLAARPRDRRGAPPREQPARRGPGRGDRGHAADAYTVPGWPCRIVITQGMLRALSAAERGVLLAHERSHARNSHYLFTSAARLAAAANPLLRPVAAQAGYTVERWADERAASQAGDRTLAARAIARAALATSAAPPGRDAAMTALGLITQEGERRRRAATRAGGPRAAAPC